MPKNYIIKSVSLTPEQVEFCDALNLSLTDLLKSKIKQEQENWKNQTDTIAKLQKAVDVYKEILEAHQSFLHLKNLDEEFYKWRENDSKV